MTRSQISVKRLQNKLFVDMAQHINYNVLYTAELTRLSNQGTIFITRVKTAVQFNNTAENKRLMHIQHIT